MAGTDRSLDVCVMAGDGIGPEVIAAACEVVDSLPAAIGPRCVWNHVPAGHGAYQRTGDPLPADSLAAAHAADAVLVGAMDVAQIPGGVPQPLQGLRQGLDVAASVRRNRTLPGVAVPTRSDDVDILVVREVTEGGYSGVEYPVGDDGACAVRVITRAASTRVARVAFAQARDRNGLVTAVHKRGAMPVTDALWLDAIGAVAADFPDVRYETKNVDACAMEMIQHPQAFDTVLCPSASGDILSDVAAGLVGGLGLAASACIGERWAYFEPVHGTAPDIAGTGVANPLAAILSAALMLAHVGNDTAAGVVEQAVVALLADDRAPRTPDLGGSAGTSEVTAAVCARVAAATPA